MIQTKILYLIFTLLLLISCNNYEVKKNSEKGNWLLLNQEDISSGMHHTNHFKLFGKYSSGYNKSVLKAIDKVQSTAMDGGGYFTGVKADPPESPIGYNLSLLGKKLLNLDRKTSYCSGASYSAFIESMNTILENNKDSISADRMEALRMQEEDGGRREDGVKFWGKWNADGFGNNYALVQYSNIGKVIKPEDARPGDFMNISWKSGNGHSVVFLGWILDQDKKLNVVYWSSQKRTNGLGDDVVPVDRIKNVMIVRITDPNNIYKFNVKKEIQTQIPGFKINFKH